MQKKLVAALSALALAGVPVAVAAADPSHPPHPNRPSHSSSPSDPSKPPHPTPPTHPGNPHGCKPHTVGYVVSGTLVSSTLTSSGRQASGTITIKVTSANKHARDAGITQGSSWTYTLTNTKVTYADSVTQPNPAAGSHTVVKGAIAVVGKKCQDKTGAGQLTLKHVVFTPST
jgi:hypothetical protein